MAQVRGDGACQFRAIADQLFSDEELHRYVRRVVVRQLQTHRSKYEGYTEGETFDAYVDRMARDGTWGDNVTLQAAADAFGVPVYLVTSFPTGLCVEVQPEREDRRFSHAIWLSFWAEVHYNSLVAPAPTEQS